MDKSEIYAILNKAYFSPDHHEKQTLVHLSKLLGRANVFVDVGASLGQYTRLANTCIHQGQIVCIEADPIRYEELVRNSQQWATTSTNSIKPIFGAATDVDGQASFFVTDSNVSGGLFEHEVGHQQQVQWRQVTVPAWTLDTICRGLSPDIIKIDVEGGELRVLKGATRILGDRKCKFLVEVHSWRDPSGQQGPNEVFAFMQRYRYCGVPYHGQTLFSPDSIWMRFLLVLGWTQRGIRWLRRRVFGKGG